MPRVDLQDFCEAATPASGGHREGDGICTGCSHSHVYRRRDRPDASIYCHDLGQYVPPDIVECNQFIAVTTLSLGQMRQIALRVDPRPGINDGSYR